MLCSYAPTTRPRTRRFTQRQVQLGRGAGGAGGVGAGAFGGRAQAAAGEDLREALLHAQAAVRALAELAAGEAGVDRQRDAGLAAELAEYPVKRAGGDIETHHAGSVRAGCTAAPAILIQTTVLRPVSQPRLLATGLAVSGVFVASRLACEGLRSGPGDSDPNDGPTARFAAEAARYGDCAEPL